MFIANRKKKKINGVYVGDAGASGSIYAGYKLDAGDDFKQLPTTWNNRNLNGEYASNAPHAAMRRISYESNHMIYIDPHWCGGASEAGIGQKYSPFTIEGEYLKITGSAIPSEAYSILPSDYTQGGGDANSKPQMFSGALKTWPSYMFSAEGNWIMEAVVRVPSGTHNGLWPSFWTSGFYWPYHGEVDIFEGQKSSASGLVSLKAIHTSATDGGSTQSAVTTLTYGTNVDIHVIAKRVGNSIHFYDDFGSTGTPILKFTDSSVVSNIAGAHDVRMELAASGNWQAGFSTSQLPFYYYIKWWRAWTPVGTPSNKPMKILGQINTTAGGSWSYSIPDDATLYGADFTPNRTAQTAIFDNADSVGYKGRANRLPEGLTVNMSTRTISGTVPSTFGGRTGVLFSASQAGGGAARRAAIFFNVAPVVKTLFANQTVAQGGAVNLSIAYTAFHSGNLGAHTYTVNKTGGSWLTITGNGTGTISITGTAPNSAQVVTLEIICTNGIGQTTTVTRTITVS